MLYDVSITTIVRHEVPHKSVNPKVLGIWSWLPLVCGVTKLLHLPTAGNNPVTRTSRSYSVSPSGEKAVWVDIRDGKGVLLLYDTVQKTESVILTKSGLGSPVEWLNNSTLVYRISTVQETADYVFSIEGTESKKIADVIGNQSRYFY